MPAFRVHWIVPELRLSDWLWPHLRTWQLPNVCRRSKFVTPLKPLHTNQDSWITLACLFLSLTKSWTNMCRGYHVIPERLHPSRKEPREGQPGKKLVNRIFNLWHFPSLLSVYRFPFFSRYCAANIMSPPESIYCHYNFPPVSSLSSDGQTRITHPPFSFSNFSLLWSSAYVSTSMKHIWEIMDDFTLLQTAAFRQSSTFQVLIWLKVKMFNLEVTNLELEWKVSRLWRSRISGSNQGLWMLYIQTNTIT